MNQRLIKIKKITILKIQKTLRDPRKLLRLFVLYALVLVGYLFLGFILSVTGLFAMFPLFTPVNQNDPANAQRLIGNSNLLKYVFSYGVVVFFLAVASYYKKKLRFFAIIMLFYWFAGLGLTYTIINPSANLNSGETAQISTISSPLPTSIPQTPTPTVYQPPAPVSNDPWGIARQIDEHTWTIRIGQDERMGTPQEILEALNAYRDKHGSGRLGWNDRLANYAQSRADFFNSKGSTDKHAGFNDFLNNQDGYNKLGFRFVGENSSYGYKVLGVHLIEWVYAGDAGHDGNQRNSSWTSVGIGVSGTSTDLIFGGDQM